MTKVFLGGTCNGSKWRDEAIKYCRLLDLDYFNPVVEKWNDEARQREEEEKKICDYNLFVITPNMKGVYSIAEAVHSAHVNPEKTIFCILWEDGTVQETLFGAHVPRKFPKDQIHSLEATARLIADIGAMWAPDLESAMRAIFVGATNIPMRAEVSVSEEKLKEEIHEGAPAPDVTSVPAEEEIHEDVRSVLDAVGADDDD